MKNLLLVIILIMSGSIMASSNFTPREQECYDNYSSQMDSVYNSLYDTSISASKDLAIEFLNDSNKSNLIALRACLSAAKALNIMEGIQ